MSDILLPNSAPLVTRGRIFHNGSWWIPIFCANCGCDGGMIVEPDVGSGWAFYLCVPCGEKWEPLANTMMVPDEVFWAKVKAEQIERYGRELQPGEVVEALKDGNHVLSQLARDRYNT